VFQRPVLIEEGEGRRGDGGPVRDRERQGVTGSAYEQGPAAAQPSSQRGIVPLARQWGFWGRGSAANPRNSTSARQSPAEQQEFVTITQAKARQDRT
jgi:hypothetical protein